MADEKNPGALDGLDVLGIKPIAKSVEVITTAAMKSAQAIFERVCYPAAKEFGLLLKDRIHHWRQANIVAMSQRLEKKMAENNVPVAAHAHPRIAKTIIEESSWTDDSAVQDMWAGLLTSSCTETGDDDSNLIFTNLLGGMTRLQAAVIKYACENANKFASPSGLIHAQEMMVPLQMLIEITGET